MRRVHFRDRQRARVLGIRRRERSRLREKKKFAEKSHETNIEIMCLYTAASSENSMRDVIMQERRLLYGSYTHLYAQPPAKFFFSAQEASLFIPIIYYMTSENISVILLRYGL